jgi:ABC-type dipeptide/oligopeptide/nickel transport system permease subunit
VSADAAVQPLRPPRASRGSALAWRRLRSSRGAVLSGGFVLFVLFAVFAGGPILARVLGHGPNDLFPYAVDDNMRPVGPLTHVPALNAYAPGSGSPAGAHTTLFVLGADGPLGRDELLRLLYGGQVSLEVAIGAAFLAVVLGATLGAAAAFFGGWVDAVISRLTDLVMAFPLLLFAVMLSGTVAPRIDAVTLHGLLPTGVISIVLLIGAFTWFYPARIVRAHVLSLRRSEFVEAAAMTGAGDVRIMRTHLVPHLVAPLVVFATLIVATNIMLEAGITFLGVGVHLPTSSWGSMLGAAWGTVLNPIPYNASTFQPWLTVVPSLAIFMTVLALNQLGEELRRAFDPLGRR